MSPIFAFPIAIIIGIACYLLIILLLPKSVIQGRTTHFRSAMQRLEEQQKHLKSARPSEKLAPLRRNLDDNILIRAFLMIPGAQRMIAFVEEAGLINKLDKLILAFLLIWLALTLLLSSKLGIIGALIGFVVALYGIRVFVKIRINKRRKLFLSMLPDALDIIVRSIRSGYPINAAIGMVADSLPPQVGAEYVRVMNEASYGYTLGEAVTRFGARMQEPDVSFFAVVVNLQQETGGNLTETLGNLSSVIRQRQQLRLKVRSLSAEGRMTVIILVGIAIFMIGAVYTFAPEHFNPLFKTSTGHTVMMVIGSIFFVSYLIIKKIINFKV